MLGLTLRIYLMVSHSDCAFCIPTRNECMLQLFSIFVSTQYCEDGFCLLVFNVSHSNSYSVHFYFNLYSSLTNDGEHLFSCLFAIHIFSSVKCLLNSFTCFLIGLFVFLTEFFRVLYIFSILVLITYVICTFFLPVCSMSFHSLYRMFPRTSF